jgi:DNA-binding CsgD family transcriptional regulator
METRSTAQLSIAPDIAEDTAGICVANLDAELRLLEANDEFIDKLGWSATDLYGQPFSTVVHSSVEQVIQEHLDLLAQGQQLCFNTRFVGVMTASRRFSGSMTGLAVRGDHGTVTTIVVLVRPDTSVSTDQALSEPMPALSSRKRRPLSALDARVLEGVAAGNSTIQLANKLYLSRQGIDYHVNAMLRRFKCSKRSALVAKAYAQGILTQGVWPPKVTDESTR